MIPRTYDQWKTTNPADEWLGHDPPELEDERTCSYEHDPGDDPDDRVNTRNMGGED